MRLMPATNLIPLQEALSGTVPVEEVADLAARDGHINPVFMRVVHLWPSRFHVAHL